jgi:hypothetical protein
MKKLLYHFIFITAMLGIAAGCKKDDEVKKKEKSELIQGSIAGVNGPISGTVNQELTFNLVWQNTDSTTTFSYLRDSSFQNTRIVKLYALTNVPDTLADNKKLNAITYKFKADSAGTYYLKFYKGDNSDKSVIIDTVEIRK